jgi:hypothetical protein
MRTSKPLKRSPKTITKKMETSQFLHNAVDDSTRRKFCDFLNGLKLRQLMPFYTYTEMLYKNRNAQQTAKKKKVSKNVSLNLILHLYLDLGSLFF